MFLTKNDREKAMNLLEEARKLKTKRCAMCNKRGLNEDMRRKRYSSGGVYYLCTKCARKLEFQFAACSHVLGREVPMEKVSGKGCFGKRK